MFNIFEHMSLKELQSIINTPDLGADTLLKCAMGVKATELEAYCALVKRGPITIQSALEILEKSRSTTQRLLQGLVEKGLAVREETLIGLGGYKYVYKAVSPKRLKVLIEAMLNDWYTKMLIELEEFPQKIQEIGCGPCI